MAPYLVLLGLVGVDLATGPHEARDLQRRFVPLQRLAPVLIASGLETPGATLDQLLGELARITGGVLGDDLALRVLQRGTSGATETSA